MPEDIEAQNEAPPAETQQDPNSLESREKALAEAKAEYEQNMTSIEANFAKAAVQFCNENANMDDLYFDDRLEFFNQILQFQNEFLIKMVKEPMENIQKMESEIGQEKDIENFKSAQAEFLQKHPDVNIQELMDFYMSLDEQTAKSLENLSPLEFLEALYELMQSGGAEQAQSQDEQQANSDELPRQASGMSANIDSMSPESEIPSQRY